jgi:hypothetical protein
VVTPATGWKGRNVKNAGRYTGRRVANSLVMRFLARAGLAACGVLYVVIRPGRGRTAVGQPATNYR